MYFPLKLLVKFIMKYVFINIFIIQIKKIHKHIYQNHSQQYILYNFLAIYESHRKVESKPT